MRSSAADASTAPDSAALDRDAASGFDPLIAMIVPERHRPTDTCLPRATSRCRVSVRAMRIGDLKAGWDVVANDGHREMDRNI
jgi:hypothetical protein